MKSRILFLSSLFLSHLHSVTLTVGVEIVEAVERDAEVEAPSASERECS